ncbi:MAG: flavodoxin family protein [Planctomyces sp.]|nr:flavodoxin family protein [Planctomyces sp.]
MPPQPTDQETATAIPPDNRSPGRGIAIICHSVHHGNTMQIAKSMAEEFSAQGWTVELLDIEEAAAADLSQYAMVGLGSGIYFGRHHPEILKLAETINPPPQVVFLFSTAGLPFLKLLQHGALRRRIKRRSILIMGEHCCRGWDTVGPLWLMGGINRQHPNATDLAKTRTFAHTLSQQLKEKSG